MDIDEPALLQAVGEARRQVIDPHLVDEIALSRSQYWRLGRVGTIRDWLAWLAIDEQPNVAFADTTLLHTVRALTLGEATREVTATSLLDLCTFAEAVVLCDRIVHLPYVGDSFDLNEALREPVFAALPVVDFDAASKGGGVTDSADVSIVYGDELHGMGAVLGDLLGDAIYEVRKIVRSSQGDPYHGDLLAMARQWGAVLGRSIDRADLSYLWEGSRWDSDGPKLLVKLLRFQDGAEDLEDWARFPAWMEHQTQDDPEEGLAAFISECNTRSFFNLRVAAILDVPYVGNATRLPIRGHQYRTAVFMHHQLLLADEIDAEVNRHRASYAVSSRQNLSLPVFGALALHDARTPAELLDSIAALRGKAAPLRARRVEYDHALRTGTDPATIGRVRQALADDAAHLASGLKGPVASGIAAALAAAAGPTTAWSILGISALSTAGAMDPETRRGLVRRLLRPSQWWLTDTASRAKAIASSATDVQRVFGLDGRGLDGLRRRLDQLAAVGLT
jgi:hypothetical protein